MGASHDVVIGLTAVVFAIEDGRALALTTASETGGEALPFGPFDPDGHRTFELALRAFVAAQTGFDVGYVEQLYTFGDRGREAPQARLTAGSTARVISVGYLGLAPSAQPAPQGAWSTWYRYFPWEDHRHGRPAALEAVMTPALRSWADDADTASARAARWDRARIAFGLDGVDWNEERTLDRFELLYEARLVSEAHRDAGETVTDDPNASVWGDPMASDHRRILATAVARLRAKVKYRPVIFELMPDVFTLSNLQRAVETVLGLHLHKQNFRRGLNASGLVEGTGAMETATGGRPAELFRFRRDALRNRPALGVAAPRAKDA